MEPIPDTVRHPELALAGRNGQKLWSRRDGPREPRALALVRQAGGPALDVLTAGATLSRRRGDTGALVPFEKELVAGSVAATLRKPPSAPYDVVFSDPPYPLSDEDVATDLAVTGSRTLTLTVED